MNLFPSTINFNVTPLNIFWSIVTIYVSLFISTYLIYFYRLLRFPAFRPLSSVYFAFLSLARGEPGAFRKLIEVNEHYFQKDGYAIVWFACIPFLMIGRYDRAQQIIGEPATLDKGLPFKAAETFFGQGIISSRGDKWKSRRRLVRQQFSPLSIVNYVDYIRSLSESINKSIDQSITDGKDLDIRGFFSVVTMKMILGKAAGVELSEKDYVFLIEAMEKFLGEMDKRLVFPPFYFDSIYEIYIQWSGVRAMIDKTDRILIDAIRSKYHEIKDDLKPLPKSPTIKADAAGYDPPALVKDSKDNETNEFPNTESNKKSNSLTELLLRTWINAENGSKGAQLTGEIEQAIVEEIKSVLVAGSDGPDSLMTWFVYILGCYPEYQERIYEEVKDIDVQDWTMATINSFSYLDQCFRESTRLYTSVPIKIRALEQDQMVDGKIMPKGTLTIVSLISILRDSKIFPEPFQFKPERFAPDATPKIPNGAYIPFGIRPRDCIGQRLAPLYIKFMVASLIKSFKIKSHRHWYDIDYKVIFVFKPTDPMNVTFTRRQSTS